MPLSKNKSSTSQPPETEFNLTHFEQLSENENERYALNSERVAHLVVYSDENGEEVAEQYTLPESTTTGIPQVRELSNIQKVETGGRSRYQGDGSGGEKFKSKRFDRVQIKRGEKVIAADLHYLSESDSDEETSGKVQQAIPRFTNAPENPPVVKGGHDMVVDPASVRSRDLNNKRSVDQNTIMGRSARDAYELFFKDMEAQLSPELIRILQRAFKANINKKPENEVRPEWLHGYGHGLTPSTENPQHKGNLGAAPKWANTEMMVLERIAKWFALNHETDTRITINPLFEMLGESELINKIHFEVSLEFKASYIRFMQDLDPFKEHPVFRKASDLAQATGISHAILHGKPPIKREKITPGKIVEKLYEDEAPYVGHYADNSLEESADLKQAMAMLALHSQYKVCKRVPESFTPKISNDPAPFIVTIIDLETTGTNSVTDKIIELGMLSFYVSKEDGILSVIDAYNGLNDPKRTITQEITRLTGITNADVKGKTINWNHVHKMLDQTNLVICHNSLFDRKFLERQTPLQVSNLVRALPFGCTLQDINWGAKGFDIKKLDALNFKLGYFFDGHRALNDCWATFNLLNQVEGSIPELMSNINKNQTVVCVTDAAPEVRTELKLRHFRWSDGSQGNIPQCWWTCVYDDQLEELQLWLSELIKSKGHFFEQKITAVERYSAQCEYISPTYEQHHPLTVAHIEDAPITKNHCTMEELNKAVAIVSAHPGYKVFNEVPRAIPFKTSYDFSPPIITIIHLKTTGRNPLTDHIREIGMVSFSYSKQDGALGVVDVYNGLNASGQTINWDHVSHLLNKTNYVVCHNSHFARNFLELQTPNNIKARICSLPFSCTQNEIDWKAKGFANKALEYLNFKMGYFYNSNSAEKECWAVLNVLQMVEGALEALMLNINRPQTLICAEKAPYEKRDLLKQKGFQWSDGARKGGLPKTWWACVYDEELDETKEWLDRVIYKKEYASDTLPQRSVTAVDRYSLRAEFIAPVDTDRNRFWKKRPQEEQEVSDASTAKCSRV